MSDDPTPTPVPATPDPFDTQKRRMVEQLEQMINDLHLLKVQAELLSRHTQKDVYNVWAGVGQLEYGDASLRNQFREVLVAAESMCNMVDRRAGNLLYTRAP